MFEFENLRNDAERWAKVQEKWDRMSQVAVKDFETVRVSTEGMIALGIPYYDFKLQDLVKEYFMGGEIVEETKGGEYITERVRVHLNQIPYGLLCALHHISPWRDKYSFLQWLDEEKKLLGNSSDYPFLYTQRERGALVRVGGGGRLLELPENLDSALRSGMQYNFQKDFDAFYAPLRVREILYYTTPDEKRNYFLLDDCECQRLAGLTFPVTEDMFRFRLLERIDEVKQVKDIDDQLFDAILCGEVNTEEELLEYDRV